MLETFTALADPNRFRIVEVLRDGPQPVNALVEKLALSQPQVSKHLAVLKRADLVGVEPRAQQRVYRLNGAQWRALNAWTEQYRALWSERFDQIDAVIDELKREDKPE
jgi:DNA-binding transcriptional ArsR family regulator